MKLATPRAAGYTLILVGAMVVLCREQIVFPGLERLVGAETIVGKQNVIYQADGSYLLTNPGAIARWISLVAGIGILICALGGFLLLRAPRPRDITGPDYNAIDS